MAADRYRGESTPALPECAECGSRTTREVCRKCRLLESLATVYDTALGRGISLPLAVGTIKETVRPR